MRNRGLSDGERELLNRIISEERPRRSYAEDAPVADAQPEGESLSRFKAATVEEWSSECCSTCLRLALSWIFCEIFKEHHREAAFAVIHSPCPAVFHDQV